MTGPTDIENALLRRLLPSEWDAAMRARRLSGVRVAGAELTEAGIVVQLVLDGELTVSGLQGKRELLAAALRLPVGVPLVVRPGAAGGTAVMRLVTRSPLDGCDMRWRPGCAGIGLDTLTGEPVVVDPFGFLLGAGATGTGKSVSVRPLIAEVLDTRNAALVMIDPKVQEGALYRGADGAPDKCRVATSEEEIWAVSGELERELDYRQNHAGGTLWEPSGRHPEIVVLVDEGAGIVRMAAKKQYRGILDRFERLATMGRASRIWLIWLTQYPTKADGIPPQVVEMMLRKFSLTLESPTADRVVFGERAQREGWEPSRLSGAPGEALVKVDRREPDPVRMWFMDDDAARALPPGIVWYGPPEPAEVTAADALTRIPIVPPSPRKPPPATVRQRVGAPQGFPVPPVQTVPVWASWGLPEPAGGIDPWTGLPLPGAAPAPARPSLWRRVRALLGLE